MNHWNSSGYGNKPEREEMINRPGFETQARAEFKAYLGGQ